MRSVVAAFLDSGGLNARTPVAIASVPVRATAPPANARTRRMMVTGSRTDGAPGSGILRCAALAEDEHPERADRDHQEGAADEQVRRQREDVAGLAEAPEVAESDERDGTHADEDPEGHEFGDCRRDLLDSGGRGDRNGHDVVDEEGRRRNERGHLTEVGPGNGV